MRGRDQAFRILDEAMTLAAQGVDDVEVALGGGVSGLTRFADSEVHQSVEMNREWLSVRVILEGKSAKVRSSDLSTQGIQAAAQQARILAQYLPKPTQQVELPGSQEYRAIESYDVRTEKLSALDRLAVAARMILRANDAGLGSAGYVATTRGGVDPFMHGDRIYAVSNTLGLRAYHAATRASVSVTMNRGEASGWSQQSSYTAGEVDAVGLADVAIQKALLQTELSTVPPGRYTVVLEPAAVAALLDFLAQSSGLEDMVEERSYLSGNLGKKIAASNVTILDDHAHPLHRGVPFDADGVAKKKVTLIQGGLAAGPVNSFANALRHGVAPTGHALESDVFGECEAATNLVMLGGDSTAGDLLGSTQQGILVTRFWYVRLVEPRKLQLTGVTRDGTFLVRNGEIVTGLKNLRFNVSLLDLLNNLDGMTASVAASGMVVPAVRSHDFRFTSVA